MLRQHEQGYLMPYRIRYPVELHPPPGFKPDNLVTWPRIEGRLEYSGGRLLYMPPCADVQQDVTTSATFILMSWAQSRPGFVVGSNEAGMILGEDTRAADAAVWMKAEVGAHTGRLRRVPPVLAVEVAGQDEGEPELRPKARWYLDHGVQVVWLVLPESREVLVLTSSGEERREMGERLPEHPALPGLSPEVRELFTQLE